MALTDKLTAIGDAIREKTGSTELLTLDEMPNEIASITTGGGDIPEEALTITGDCSYRFTRDGWNWFIEEYGNQITTKNIHTAKNMFASSLKLENIPFELNFDTTRSDIDIEYLFASCEKLVALPTINGCKTADLTNIFQGCRQLREIPDDIGIDTTQMNSLSSTYSGNMSNAISQCYSLRKFPRHLFINGNPNISNSYSYFKGLSSLHSMDEITDMPIPYTSATWTSNAFNNSFNDLDRVKNITFAMNEDGTPIVVKWKSQTIAFAGRYIGFGEKTYGNARVTTNNSGITADKEVYDDATYQALKDDDDWFSCNSAYSRYNHDSAVATLNSLPDTSAYLASAGGTNTILFTGSNGSATDGGAINTLTEEEIAVATAKGWTVSLV